MTDLLEEPIYRRAFNAGAKAARTGLGKEENPYDAQSRRHSVWLLGYQSANPYN